MTARLQDFTLWMGLNLCELVENFSKVKPGLKWPNDLHIGGKKAGAMTLVGDMLKRRGFDVQIMETAGAPVVYGLFTSVPRDTMVVGANAHIGVAAVEAAVGLSMIIVLFKNHNDIGRDRVAETVAAFYSQVRQHPTADHDAGDQRDDEPKTGIDGLLVLAEALDDAPLVRLHDPDAGGDVREEEEAEDGQDDDEGH